MTMFDSSPERRNLTVLSISIILFYLADGKIEGSSLNLNMLNLSFNNLHMLQYSIIIFLIWFVFRYWVTARAEFKKKYFEEIKNINVTRLYRFFIDNSTFRNDIIIYPSSDGHVFLNASTNREVFKSFGGIMIFFFIIVNLFFTKPTLSGYVVPYFLAIFAFGFIFGLI